MKKMPMIGVSGSIEKDEGKQYIVRAYMTSLLEAGALPVLLSIDMDEPQIDLCLNRLDGLVLSGGNDVDPLLFGESPANGLDQVNPIRDRLEMSLIGDAYRRSMPVFAICRGLQTLNVALGGTLYQDLPTQYTAPDGSKPILHTQTSPSRFASHMITVDEPSPLRSIFGEGLIGVNSFHHQAIKALAPALTVCARAADGVVEAVYDANKPFVLGVQWHPERMREGAPLFHAFVEACETFSLGKC